MLIAGRQRVPYNVRPPIRAARPMRSPQRQSSRDWPRWQVFRLRSAAGSRTSTWRRRTLAGRTGLRSTAPSVLENWFPTATGIRMRGGTSVHAVTPGLEDITALFTYVDGNNRSLFSATATKVFDVTASFDTGYIVDDLSDYLVDDLGDRIIFGNDPVPVVSGLSGGDWSVVQFSTPAGAFLRAVNGVNTPRVYDGATWSTAPAITGVTPESLSYVWSFKNRLFFVQKDTQNAWYLPVDSIGGAAVEFPLGGVFTRGGSLLFGASWSTDGGGGLSEQCAFFSSEGEVAVYQGTDPSTAMRHGARLASTASASRAARRRSLGPAAISSLLRILALFRFLWPCSATSPRCHRRRSLIRSRRPGTRLCLIALSRHGTARSGRPARWCWWFCRRRPIHRGRCSSPTRERARGRCSLAGRGHAWRSSATGSSTAQPRGG
jgi:hypothetical protein